MNFMRKKNEGFSLYEILVAIGILALVAVLAIPQVQRASFESKVEVEKANIALIQEAKEAYAADNPGTRIPDFKALLPYLPDQQMPQSPFGTPYVNVEDLDYKVGSGSIDFEEDVQNNFVVVAKSAASGYNGIDGGGVSSPIVALNVPTPTPTSSLVTPAPVTPTPTPSNRNPGGLLEVYPYLTHRGVPVQLKVNASDPDGDSLSYQFSAGGQSFGLSTSPTMSLSFPSLGIKPVSVLITDGKGGSFTANSSVNVANRVPSIFLESSATNSFRNTPIEFKALASDLDGDSLSYQFKINDDAPLAAGAGSILNKAFDKLGTQKVAVTVNDGFGGVATASKEVLIENRPPTAELTPSSRSVYPGASVTFTTTGSDPDNDTLSYTYTIDGQTLDKSTNPSVSRSFSSLGTKNASVLVEDGFGGSLTKSLSINVTDAPNNSPSVTLTASPSTVVRGQSVTFTANGIDPDGDTLEYSFNNGAFGSAKVFTTSYNTIGLKSVTVRVRDSRGAETPALAASVNVVNRNPFVTLTPSPTRVDTGKSVSFTAKASDPDGDALQYRYQVDGTWSGYTTGTSTSKVWTTAGTKTVAVEVTDSMGNAVATASTFVEVPEFVFYWNNGVSPIQANSVIMSSANAGQHNNFSAVMAAINSVGVSKVQAAINAGGSTQRIVGSRTAQSGERLSYGGGWVGGYSGNWNVHVRTSGKDWKVEKVRKVRQLFLSYHYSRVTKTFHTYRQAYWYRTVTATKTVSEYQSRVMQANSIVGVNPKTGEVVTIPAAQWASVMAGNVQVNGQSVKVAGYAGMTGAAEEFLVRQYDQARQWNEHYTTTTEHINTFKQKTPWVFEYRTGGHPVTISFTKGGDFLSGEWRNLKDRNPDSSAMREFNLDGKGVKGWEWVGPTEGILVVNEAKDPMFQPNGTHLFGFDTWGQKWNNATEPMKTLDKDSDGFLTGSELDTVWVWVDANTDAIVQEGELTTLPEKGITSILVNNQEDGKGGEWFPGGAAGPSGTFDMVDWWSVR